MKNILVICGPTASGKTSLAVSVASVIASFGNPNRSNLTPSGTVHILSADSRQVYKYLDIVTGKDIPADLPPSINFFGLDLVEPNQSFNLSDYVQYSKKVIQESLSQKVPLIIVGGTGLYLKAITSNLLTVNIPPNESLRGQLEKLDLSALKTMLLKINPQKFASLNHSDVNNPRRLIRALEISLSPSLIGEGLSPVRDTSSLRGGTPTWQSHSTPTFLWIGLHQDKEAQKAKINQRVLERLNAGAIDEVKKLIKKYPDKSLALFTSLGVREIIEFLNQKISREELINLWTLAENDYARRQMVWFKKQPGIIWYDTGKVNNSLAVKLAELLKQND